MDGTSYRKLVKDSPVFGNFSEGFKTRLLNAKGADMARYASMLEGVKTTMAAAQDDLIERDKKVMTGLREDLRQINREKNKHVESRVRKEDSRRGENLLEQLNEIK